MDVTREITREEAIANLNMISVAFVEPVTEEQRKLIDDTFDMAIKALEQEPCEDCISRKSAILEIQRHGVGCFDADNFNPEQAERFVINRLNGLPSIQPKPKTGHWIRWYERKENDRCIEHIPHCKCSECGKEYDPHSSLFIKYCNECGARMQEVKE